MLAPKRVKFRKQMKGRMRGVATRGQTVAFGHFGLQALEEGWVTNRQIEAARVAMTRSMKRGGKLWIRLCARIACSRRANRQGSPQLPRGVTCRVKE